MPATVTAGDVGVDTNSVILFYPALELSVFDSKERRVFHFLLLLLQFLVPGCNFFRHGLACLDFDASNLVI